MALWLEIQNFFGRGFDPLAKNYRRKPMDVKIFAWNNVFKINEK
jgi:hypothetical protein